MSRRRIRFLAFVTGLGLALGASGAAFAAFFATTSNSGNSFSAAPDLTAPTAGASVIQRSPAGYLAGSIRPGATYYVFASVTDTGNPASGVASVTADVSTITAGQTAAALASGSYTVQGVSYNYRSALLTADAGLTAGAKPYTLTMTDAAGNAGTQSFSVTVDTTVPAGSDVQTANGGATAGKAEAGDTITFTFSEQIDPGSILAGWTGASTLVTVRLNNGGGGNDSAQIWNAANTAELALGSVNLGRTDYVTASRTFGSSTMVQSGNTIVVTLGTASGVVPTAGGTGTMTWTPSATATDGAGNACSTAAVTESGAADVEF